MLMRPESLSSVAETNHAHEMQTYRENLLLEAESFLLNPSLEELLLASEVEGRITSEEMDSLIIARDTGNREEYFRLTATLITRAMDWRTMPNGRVIPRHEIESDKDLMPSYRETIRLAAYNLMMSEEHPVPDKSYPIAAILGATAEPLASRTDFLFDTLESNIGSAELVVGLGAERRIPKHQDYTDVYKILPPELFSPLPYIQNAQVETDLLSFAQQKWFSDHGYDTPEIIPFSTATSRLNDKNYDSKYSIQTITFGEDDNKPKWTPDTLVNVSAPHDKTHHDHANTGETVEFLVKIAGFNKGDTVLFVSSQPYLLGQKFETQRLCLQYSLRADVAGYGSPNLNLSATALGSEIAKAVTKAYELRMALVQLNQASI